MEFFIKNVQFLFLTERVLLKYYLKLGLTSTTSCSCKTISSFGVNLSFWKYIFDFASLACLQEDILEVLILTFHLHVNSF